MTQLLNLKNNESDSESDSDDKFYSSVRIHIYDKKDIPKFKKLAKKIRGKDIFIEDVSKVVQADLKKKGTAPNPLFNPDSYMWWQKYWKNMPEFEQKEKYTTFSTQVHFKTEEALNYFSETIGMTVNKKTKFIHYPEPKNIKKVHINWLTKEEHIPQYPIYVITKGRWESRLTIKMLEKINCPYRCVVEPQEYDKYAQYVDEEKIITTPFSNLGQGSIPVRNFVWEHSIKEGHERHWILDDNIRDLYRLLKNERYRVMDPAPFKIVEDFTNQFKNIGLSGMHYKMFAPDNFARPPFFLNTRVYSCILIKNDLDFRWRGRFNEDTDLSLRVLKQKYCTVLFNAFLVDKIATMTMKGGNTEELYEGTDNRKEFAESLKEQHPKLVKIIKRWGRWHHYVNYDGFTHKLQRRDDIDVPDTVNSYGLKLINTKKETI